MLSLGIVAAALYVGVFSIPVYADTTMYSQTASTHDTGFLTNNNSGPTSVQYLGTGLSGDINEVSIMAAFGSTGNTWHVDIISCTSSSYASCPGSQTNWQGEFTPTASTTTQYFVDHVGSFDVPMIASRYYWMQIYKGTADGQTIKLYGTTSNLYTNGDCFRFVGGSSQACGGSLNDIFFLINGVQTAYDTSYTSNIIPTNASTTQSTTVQTGFSYHAVASQNINSYILSINDTTVSQNITLTGTAATGDATISRTLTLTSGHQYIITAAICNSSGTCYGGPSNYFSVVNSSFGIGTTYSTSSITAQPPYVDTSALQLPEIVDSIDVNATTTSESDQSTFLQGLGSFVNIPALISRKLPFGYFWDIRDIYDAASTSSTAVAAVSFDFSDTSISTGTRAWMPGNIIVLSSTTVWSYIPTGVRDTFFLLVNAAIWVGFLASVWALRNQIFV